MNIDLKKSYEVIMIVNDSIPPLSQDQELYNSYFQYNLTLVGKSNM